MFFLFTQYNTNIQIENQIYSDIKTVFCNLIYYTKLSKHMKIFYKILFHNDQHFFIHLIMLNYSYSIEYCS